MPFRNLFPLLGLKPLLHIPMTVIPYKHATDGKKSQVARMFNNIAPRYDLLNHLLSMGIDKIWRRKVIQILRQSPCPRVLDVATGTGDMAIAIHRRLKVSVTGLDLSEQMLNVARQKVARRQLTDVTLVQGDSEGLPFDSSSFDAVTVAFGVRNFENLEQGLREMKRVLVPGGRMLVLEFSKPSVFPVKQLFRFYSSTILPFLGGLISKDRAAYDYLPQSVEQFPEGEDFMAVLRAVGMAQIRQYRLSFGIATIYFSVNPVQ